VSEQQKVIEQFEAWLQEHNVTLTIKIQTPRGEYIAPENFIPAGFVAMILLEVKQDDTNSPG
jgi:hypothetical protein